MVLCNQQNLILQMLSKICCFNTDITKFSCCTLTRNKLIKLCYIFILVLAYSVLFIINSKVQNLNVDTVKAYGCYNQQKSASNYQCVKNKNSLLMFVGVGVMHFILMCSMFCKSQKVKIINEGLWIVKILIAALICLFFRLMVGTALFQYLEYFSVWAANLIYIFISIVFIDFVYVFDGSLDEWALQNSKIYILKAIVSITFFISSSFLCFLSYYHVPNYVFWVNTICLATFLILALLRMFPGNSILVSSLVSLCINIIGFYIKGDDNEVQKWDGFLLVIKLLFIVFLLLGMLCEGSSKLRTKKSTFNELLALNTNSNQEDNRYVSSNKWTVYHYVMMIIAVTIPCVICWQEEGNSRKVNQWMETNNLTWWIASISLYCWSLVCSKLFPEKDFSDLQNYFREYQLQ